MRHAARADSSMGSWLSKNSQEKIWRWDFFTADLTVPGWSKAVGSGRQASRASRAVVAAWKGASKAAFDYAAVPIQPRKPACSLARCRLQREDSHGAARMKERPMAFSGAKGRQARYDGGCGAFDS